MAFPIAMGKTVAFGSGAEGLKALAGGWSRPEQGQVWSDGPHAALRFRVADLPHESSIVLHASPYLAGSMQAQRLILFGNGLYIGATALEKSGEATLAIPSYIGASVMVMSLLDLAFHIPDCRPGDGSDQRMLGFALHALQLRAIP